MNRPTHEDDMKKTKTIDMSGMITVGEGFTHNMSDMLDCVNAEDRRDAELRIARAANEFYRAAVERDIPGETLVIFITPESVITESLGAVSLERIAASGPRPIDTPEGWGLHPVVRAICAASAALAKSRRSECWLPDKALETAWFLLRDLVERDEGGRYRRALDDGFLFGLAIVDTGEGGAYALSPIGLKRSERDESVVQPAWASEAVPT
jgi:hypothetical protein